MSKKAKKVTKKPTLAVVGATGAVGTGDASGFPATSVPNKIRTLASPSFPPSVGIGTGMIAVATPPSSVATSLMVCPTMVDVPSPARYSSSR